MRNLFCISVTFWAINFTAINKEYFNKNPLKISQHLPENACVVFFFYKVTGLEPSGLQIFKNTYFEEYLPTAYFCFFQVNSLKQLEENPI